MHVMAAEDQPIHEPVCLMIGNYDGVHLGHQAIIARARELASQHGYRTAVLSFEPHPLKVLAPDKAPQLLQTPAQKRALLTYYGVDYYVIQRFDKQLAQLSPRAFVERLRAQINFKVVLIGFNFRFGHRRVGTPQTLETLGDEMGFTVEETAAYQRHGDTVSSSRVRRLVQDGAVDQAADLLGRPYFIEGRVERGQQVGRRMAIPTANLQIDNELWPRFGVYASWCRVDGRWHRAISNIGIAPTRGLSEPRVETHLLEYDGDLYDHQALVVLQQFMREEIRFDNLTDLQQQIRQDIDTRLKLADTRPPAFTIV